MIDHFIVETVRETPVYNASLRLEFFEHVQLGRMTPSFPHPKHFGTFLSPELPELFRVQFLFTWPSCLHLKHRNSDTSLTSL